MLHSCFGNFQRFLPVPLVIKRFNYVTVTSVIIRFPMRLPLQIFQHSSYLSLVYSLCVQFRSEVYPVNSLLLVFSSKTRLLPYHDLETQIWLHTNGANILLKSFVPAFSSEAATSILLGGL